MAQVETNYWDFLVSPRNDDILAIKRGSSGTGTTEVHRLDAASEYKKFNLQTETKLHLTSGSHWWFALTTQDDLVCIKMGPTSGSDKTEVHILSCASRYQEWILQTATALHLTNPDGWAFCMDCNNDLLCIERGPTTGSGKTEVHRLSAEDNYTKFNLQIATGLHLTHFPAMGYTSFSTTQQGDLVVLRLGPATGSKKTEVHVMSRASNYSTFILQKGTCLHYTDPQTKPMCWNFGIAKNSDLVCIYRGPSTGSGMTEVHMLQAASEYQKFNLHKASCLHLTARLIKPPTPAPPPEPEAPIDFSVPSYWKNKDISKGFDERCSIPPAFYAKLQWLLDQTFKDQKTRDREGSMPSSLQIQMCSRIEDSTMWCRYVTAVNELKKKRRGADISGIPAPEVRTVPFAKQGFDLDDSVNECYLFHGSTPQAVTGISEEGFMLSLSGSNAGTMFGAGCYLAEMCSKADEYAKPDVEFYDGLCAALVCRVACGQLYRTEQPDIPGIEAALKSGECDNVLGDREAAVGTYREFVIFDQCLIYPEYVILYERMQEGDGGPGYQYGHVTDRMIESLSVSSAEDAVKIFQQWDEDGNGTISRDELAKVMLSIMPGSGKEGVQMLMDNIDTNKDGVISIGEFMSWLGLGGTISG